MASRFKEPILSSRGPFDLRATVTQITQIATTTYTSPTQVVTHGVAFTRLTAAGMNNLLNLLDLHHGGKCLRPEGQSLNSPLSGWLGSAKMDFAFNSWAQYRSSFFI